MYSVYKKSPLIAGFFMTFLLTLCILNFAYGQRIQDTLNGTVTDAREGNGLAFTSVRFSHKPSGVYTDIDGKFSLKQVHINDTLIISYVGYESQRYIVQNLNSPVHIRLQSKEISTEIIIIRPEENPALAVMRKAIRNRKQNNFEQIPAFSYDSYNKVYLFPETLSQTSDQKSTTTNIQKRDSLLSEIDSLAESMHLFLWESVTHRSYQKPDKSKETILASRTSGMKEIALPLVPTDIIDFSSFYKDWIVVLGESYMSPLNNEALTRYHFSMLDTLTDGPDTLFGIRFTPAKKNFDGFEGIIHIHTGRYNIQHIRAELKVQAKDKLIRGGMMEQIFTRMQDSIWFPNQLVTEFELGAGMIPEEIQALIRLRMAARVYLKNIHIGEKAGIKRFDSDVIITENTAHLQTESFWNRYRQDTLDTRERNTYHVIDSLGEKMRFDRWIYQAQKITQGLISWKFLDMDLSRFVQYNLVEKLRTGIGIQSNEKISKYFTLGGWAGYGWGDSQVKYGTLGRIHPLKDKRWELEYIHSYDLLESGAALPFLNPLQRNQDLLGRNIRMRYMEYQTMNRAGLRSPVLNFWNQELAFQMTDINPTYDYLFSGRDKYYLNEIIWEHKIAYKEKFIRNGPFRISMGSRFPIIKLKITEGIEAPDGLGHKYRMYSLASSHTLNLHTRGKINYSLHGGYFKGDLPYGRLNVFRGNYDQSWPLMSSLSFNTMRFNEFVADRYLNFHFRYDFNNLLFHSRKWHPNVLLEYNGAWGQLKGNMNLHQNISLPLQAPEHIYQEAGIIIQTLFPQAWVRKSPTLNLLGLGIYYRLGAYSFPEIQNNLAFKLYSGFRF